jgi:hypothetical protein
MAEKFSLPNTAKERRGDDGQESYQTRLTHLIDYAKHSMHRPETAERADEIHAAFRSALTELLKEMHVSQIDALISHLEERFVRGEHDMVVEFLANLSKLQHGDYAQEFLKLQAVTVPVEDGAAQADNTGVTRLGQAVIANFDERV